MYKNFERVLTKVELFVVSAGMILLIATVFAAAVLRWFGIDMSVSTDLAQLTFAWVCFIGADLALREKRHTGVDMLVERFSPAVQNCIKLCCALIMFFFLVFCVYYGINLCIVNAARKYQTLYISYSFATASCPVGCGLMCLTSAKQIVEYIQNMVKRDYSSYKKNGEVQA